MRKLLGRGVVAKAVLVAAPRGSQLDSYDAEIRRLVAATPELAAPAVLERLRPLGYTGGITILRDRLRRFRSLDQPERGTRARQRVGDDAVGVA